MKFRKSINIGGDASQVWNLEALEARRLMTVAGASVVDGVLVVKGTAGDDGLFVLPCNDGTTLAVYVNEVYTTVSRAGIVGVRIEGGDGNDTLGTQPWFDLPMTLVGNAGDDTLLGGQAPDLLLGGAGEDELYAVTPRDYGFPSPRLPRGVVVGLDTLYAARGDDTLVGDGADDGFHGEPRALDDMWINLHDGTLRIRATPGHRLDLKLASSEGLPVLSPSIYDYDFNAVLCGDRLLRDVRSIEVMGGMTPADVSFDEGFAATGIPVCFVTEWSHKQAAAPVEAPAAPSAGAEVATVAAPSPSPAPAGAFAANPLLVSDSKVWDL